MEPSLKRPSVLGEFASLNPDFVTAAGWLVEEVVAPVEGAVAAVAAATVLATVLAEGVEGAEGAVGAVAGASGFFSVGTGLSLKSEKPSTNPLAYTPMGALACGRRILSTRLEIIAPPSTNPSGRRACDIRTVRTPVRRTATTVYSIESDVL